MEDAGYRGARQEHPEPQPVSRRAVHISLNPYRGCEHGCIYCFARPTHSYLGLSPGLDFESKIFAKVNAPELLKQELGKPSHVPSRSRLASIPMRISHANASCG